MTIGELTYSLGAEWDQKSLENIKSGLASVAQGFTVAVGLVTGAVGGMFAITKQFTELNDELGKTARNRDIAIDSYEALKYSFQGAGIEGDKVKDVLEELQEAKGAFAQGGGDRDLWQTLGINPNKFKTNEELFYATIDRLSQVKDKNIQNELSKRLFKTQDLANLFDGGSEAIKQQKKELEELGVLTSEVDYKNSAEFNKTLLKTMTILNGFAKKVFAELAPIFTDLMKSFESFLKANGSLIRSGLKEFLAYVISGSKFFIDLLGRIINHIGGIKVIAIALGAILLVWQLPLIIAIGAVIALMLAFDDLMNFIKGEQSVIGDLVNSIKEAFEIFKADFPNIGAIVQAQLDNVFAIFNYFKNNVFNLWDLITGKIDFVTFLKNQISSLEELLGTILNSFTTTFTSIGNIITDTFKSIPFVEDAFKFFGSNTTVVQNQPAQVSPVPINPTNPTSNTYNYNINANVNANSKNVGDVIKEIKHPSGY